MHGKHKDLEVRLVRPHVLQQVEPTFSWQSHVQNNNIRIYPGNGVEGEGGITRGQRNLEVRFREDELGDRFPHQGMIFHDKNPLPRRRFGQCGRFRFRNRPGLGSCWSSFVDVVAGSRLTVWSHIISGGRGDWALQEAGNRLQCPRRVR